MRMYLELAPWFHLLTDPASYAHEAQRITRRAEAVLDRPGETLLELGSGGGNTASHLKQLYACTLSDVSQAMLDLSRTINPECEHVVGDMRALRLGRTFDIVLIHDAIEYMTNEEDLGAAIGTAAAHVRRGGVAIFMPDAVTDTYTPSTEHGGHDDADGRGLRYLEWCHDVNSDETTYDVDYSFLIREPGQPIRTEHERHTFGLFSRATWLRLIASSGLHPADADAAEPKEGEGVVFVARH